jgi:polyisoprenyl-teichoic acid--peptidoglycan teichoic acid transferase
MLKKAMLKKVWITLGIIVGVVVIGVGGYAYHLYSSVKDTASKIYVPSKNHVSVASKSPKGNLKPVSILLMGVDQRPGDVGRSDTLMVMTLNPQTKETQMVSIPRDTRVDIPGKGIHKINAAYAYGGTTLAKDTINQFLNVPVDYYIRINMEGLVSLVDAVGGVDVNNDISWHDEGYYKKGFDYHKGMLHMDGKEALGFVRMRHLDPRGDFGRNKRQRDVIKAVVDKAMTLGGVSKFNDILTSVQGNVRTNLDFNDMTYIAENYKNCRATMNTYEMKGQGTTINGIYYLVVNNQEKQKVHQMIIGQLKSTS